MQGPTHVLLLTTAFSDWKMKIRGVLSFPTAQTVDTNREPKGLKAGALRNPREVLLQPD